MNTQDKFDLFIEGLLSEKEIQELRRQLNDDPVLFNEFKKYVETSQLLRQELGTPLLSDNDDLLLKTLSLNQRLKIDEDVTEHLQRQKEDLYKGEKEFRKNIGKIIQKKSRRGIISKIHLFYKVAAVFMLVFISTMVLIRNINFSRKPINSLSVFQRFYDPVNDKTLRSYFSYNIILQKAIIAFRKADYAVANSNLDEISNDYDTEYKYHILKGLILLEKDDSENAKAFLKTAMENSSTESRYVAAWYLGLALLKENNINDAIPVFTDLNNESNPYRKDAKRILRKVKGK